MISGSLGAANAAVNVLTANSAGGSYLGAPSAVVGAVTFAVSGTWVGTLSFEASIDGTNWFAYSVNPIASGVASLSVLTAAANGNYIMHVAGFNQVRVRMSAYTSGTALVTAETTAGNDGVSVYSGLESPFATYTCRADKVALVAGATLVLQGSATKTVKLTRVKIGPSTATALGKQDVTVVRWSTAPTGGTAGTAPTADKFDSADGAASAAPSLYTAAPTGGTVAATFVSEQLYSPAVSTDATVSNKVEELWGNRLSKAPTVHGTGEYLAIIADAALAGQLCDVELEWVEF